jgi:hypothetical protein
VRQNGITDKGLDKEGCQCGGDKDEGQVVELNNEWSIVGVLTVPIEAGIEMSKSNRSLVCVSRVLEMNSSTACWWIDMYLCQT